MRVGEAIGRGEGVAVCKLDAIGVVVTTTSPQPPTNTMGAAESRSDAHLSFIPKPVTLFPE